MTERVFTYEDGLLEGQLIARGFTPIGNSMFFHRPNVEALYLVTQENGFNCKLEVFTEVPFVPEIACQQLVDLCRDEAHEEITVSGDLADIISVFEMHKKTAAVGATVSEIKQTTNIDEANSLLAKGWELQGTKSHDGVTAFLLIRTEAIPQH